MEDKIAELFGVPEPARPYITLFLKEEERRLISVMDGGSYTAEKLCELTESFTEDPGKLIRESYSRGVLDKVLETGLRYRSAGFYRRLAIFTQYEPELWLAIPEEDRKKIDEWYVQQYEEGARPRLEAALAGKGLIENAFFFTLEETLDLIDSLECPIYVVPCNCKSVALSCKKPKNVCINFNTGINSEWDRGHGKALTKEEAKAVIIDADRHGLMHTSETEAAICSCCGDCCYPIRASKRLGTQGIWQKKRYRLIWDSKRCISCGKCVRTCNFGAFRREGKKVTFEETACWGCTICKNHCPVGAISIEKF